MLTMGVQQKRIGAQATEELHKAMISDFDKNGKKGILGYRYTTDYTEGSPLYGCDYLEVTIDVKVPSEYKKYPC
jgi:hypothetical protein